MIVCPRCRKENQDHYKFCLGCGAELPRDAVPAPKSFSPPVPPAPVQGGLGGGVTPVPPRPPAPPGPSPSPLGAPGPDGGGAPPSAFGLHPAPSPSTSAPQVSSSGFGGATASPVQETITCPRCGTENQKNFKFCGGCGQPLQGAAPAPVAPVAAPPSVASLPSTQRGSLVVVRPDGSDGEVLPLGDTTVIGRATSALFASDSYLSPRHATFTFGASGLTVKDEGSLNGVYLRIPPDTPTELRDGQMFRIGQEIIRFERLKPQPPKNGVEIMGSPSAGLVGRICLVIGRQTTGNCYAIPASGLHLGRERGDILFPDDGYVSGLHCRLHEEGGRVMLTDVGSSNGTFLRLMGPTVVPSGSLLLMGQQLFRVEY